MDEAMHSGFCCGAVAAEEGSLANWLWNCWYAESQQHLLDF